jgi:hypothetical protein
MDPGARARAGGERRLLRKTVAPSRVFIAGVVLVLVTPDLGLTCAGWRRQVQVVGASGQRWTLGDR